MSGPQKSLQKIIDKMESYIQDLKIEPEDYFLVTGVRLWVPEYDEFKMRLRERLGTSGFREGMGGYSDWCHNRGSYWALSTWSGASETVEKRKCRFLSF